MDYHRGMLNNRIGNAGGFKRKPVMKIQRDIYNEGRADASHRSLGNSTSTSGVRIAKPDRYSLPRHALYEPFKSPKGSRTLLKHDLWRVDPTTISIPKSNIGIEGPSNAIDRVVYFDEPSHENYIAESVAERMGVPTDKDGFYPGGGKALTAKSVVLGSDDAQPTPSEASVERFPGKPKTVYSLGDNVWLRRKIPGSKTDEQDWIIGDVVKVIGEGKSRRYEVKDLNPDRDNPGGNTYRSSASQIVPIPVEGSHLDNYEIDGSVSALNPETTSHISIESNLVGLIIGRQGETLRRVEAETGCRMQFIAGPDETGLYRECRITGSRASQAKAKAEIGRIIDDIGMAGNARAAAECAREAPAVRGSSDRPASRDGEETTQITLAKPVTTTPSILFSLAAADSKDCPRAFSLLSKVSTVSRYTISQDNTQGDDARNAALLAAFGKKVRCLI